MKTMITKLVTTLAAAITLFLASCATKLSNDPNAPSGPQNASVTLNIAQASYYASASGGDGNLNFQGHNYPITVKAAGVGGLGTQVIKASGKVYNLNSLASFPGTYKGKRSGLTMLKGKMSARLENEKGTVIYLTGKTSGLSANFGIDKFVIDFK